MEEEIKGKDKGVIVIQYLHPKMSNELLCKFPDNSAFDFDYSQSSIWSPLVPRFHSLSCLNPKSPDLNRRLSFDNNNNVSFSSRIKRKICAFGLNFNAKVLKKKLNKKRLKFNDEAFDNVTSPSSKKGWKKALKMTSKQFKRKKDALPPPHHHQYHNHRHHRVTLSDYLQSQDF